MEIDAVSLKPEGLWVDRDHVDDGTEGVWDGRVGDRLSVALNVSETETVMLGLGDGVAVWDGDGSVGVAEGEYDLLREMVTVAQMLTVPEPELLLDTGEPLVVGLWECVTVTLGDGEWEEEEEGERVPHDGV